MKKISYLLLAVLALISGACGGGNNGWTDDEKAIASSHALAPVGYKGKELDCAEGYVTKHMSYNEFVAWFNSPDNDFADTLIKACGNPLDH